jgi:hypothetical protein
MREMVEHTPYSVLDKALPVVVFLIHSAPIWRWLVELVVEVAGAGSGRSCDYLPGMYYGKDAGP